MKYCSNCGSEINENQGVCLNCGSIQASQQVKAPIKDEGGFLYGLIGFCVPIAGLILFLIWRDEKPKSSKSAGIGALVSVISGIVLYVILIIIFVFIASSGGFDNLNAIFTVFR